MDKLTAIKIKYNDGTYSDEIPISVLSENVEWDSTHTLVDVLGSINVGVTGTIQDQISQLFNEKVSASVMQDYVTNSMPTYITNWLNTNVNPVGSAVVVDSSLTVSGAAADAKKTGYEIADLKSAFNILDDDIISPVYTKTAMSPTITTGKRVYANNNALVEVSDGNAAYMTLDGVNYGEVYYFSGRFTIYISGIFFIDDNTVLSYDHYNTTTENVTDYEIDIPKNCNKLVINYGTSISASLKKTTLNGYVLRPSSFIDDTAGYGSNEKTWSAAKISNAIPRSKVIVSPTIVSGKRVYPSSNALVETSDSYAAYMTLSVSFDEIYFFTGRFTLAISGIFFLNGDTLLSYEHYNTATENVTDYPILIPNNCNKLIINYSTAIAGSIRKGIPLNDVDYFPNVITVGKSGAVDYYSINDAVQAASNGSTILVFPGTYEEHVEAWYKTVHIIGVDKVSCIIKDSSSDYRTPTIEIGSGSLQNFTLIEDHASPDSSLLNGDDTDGKDWNYQRAYTIHIEDYSAHDKELLISNCVIKNTRRAAIGCGLYDKQKVRIENCYIWSGKPTRTADVQRGAVYCHNYSGSSQSQGPNASGQELKFVNCQMECDDSMTLVIADTGVSGATSTMVIDAINNMLYSEIDGKADSIVVLQNFEKGNITISAKSYGNNVSVLNK